MSELQLWTAATPNGWKVSIMIEELREAGHSLEGLIVKTIDLMAGEQFETEFSQRNPNQKIPLLIDGEQNIMESCAIVQYLAETYPSDLLPEQKRWEILPWVYWQAANVGPAFGNKLSYTRYMNDVPEEQKTHPLARFNKEARRLAGILEQRLDAHDYICGDSLSIADIVIYPWVRGWKWSKVDMSDRPNILGWLKRLRARPAFERGLAYGAPEGEVDQWSEKTKARYAQAGNRISKT
ncbi:glutathione S-transferase family protein [Pseudoteredinibacter isoporae]|uniref:glutathione S-transferase family protein n=1 Tax=Pseudoteredinibacter isoporae TaxID=570281 RepID=UPI0031088F4D